MARTFKILSPTAILGYGFPEESFLKAMAESPDLIAVDAGSSDPGPHYLGAGKPFTDRAGVKRDLRYMIVAGVKTVFRWLSARPAAPARPRTEWCRQIIHEIAQEEKLSFSMALIPSDVEKSIVHQALDNGKITALDFVPELTHEAIEESTYIVAQMGIEPFQRALAAGARWCWADGRTIQPASRRCRLCRASMRDWPCTAARSLNARPLRRPQGPAPTARWGSSTTTVLR